MKHTITIEEDRTGEQRELVLDIPVGGSAIDAVVSSGQVTDYAWSLVDVTPIGEPDGPTPADPDFPDRPRHPDFARISAAGIRVDELAEKGQGSPPEKIGIDEETLLHMVRNRVGQALSDPLVQLMPIAVQVQGAWVDGFAVGIEYQKRGGSRPTKTGNTGEKEGSL